VQGIADENRVAQFQTRRSDNHSAHINRKQPSLTRLVATLLHARQSSPPCSIASSMSRRCVCKIMSQQFRQQFPDLQTNGFERDGDRWPILIMASVCRFNEPPPTTAILVAPRTRWRWPNDETTPHSATWLIPTRNLRCPQLPRWREALPLLFLLPLPRKKPFLNEWQPGARKPRTYLPEIRAGVSYGSTEISFRRIRISKQLGEDRSSDDLSEN